MTDDVDVNRYFEVNYKNSLMKSFAQSEEALFSLADEFIDQVHVEKVAAKAGKESFFSIKVGNAAPLAIPNSSVLGLGTIYGSDTHGAARI